VAERVCALPGSKKYAPVSILFHNFFLTTINFTIAPGSFQPPPQVYSSFISLIKRECPIFVLKDENHFKSFLNTSFGQRRKKLSNNLKALNFPQIRIEQALKITEIDGNLRPEQVTLKQFVKLFNQLHYGSSPD
jgi:16S rRNA (adenine1518-N6/adenine1519-N6)-dimethyltransferase